MKRILVIAAILCSSLMVLQSCSSTKSTTASASLRRGAVTGNWVLNDITFEGVPAANVRSLFNEASYKCFIGSTWRLTNSGNGSYTLPGTADCPTRTQDIFWSVSTADETFQFKKLNEGDKAKNIADGYRLVLASTSGDQLILKSPVEYGSAPANIVLNFTKASK
ncbi:Lipocalin-like domain-containing protein [Pedobacter westerhofensis]|uniref:Lipocalin-like domain-containing protein n=1 Tax=Pedobacter westerhofensis TaxID=425512 RepID=A0A521FG10_9SPHI|nr:lipocalin family protein [Pedobacter westerhofensis]SMO95045.1 Lipocalin-like domain-containing protein [Pedobacter westerhofensis]